MPTHTFSVDVDGQAIQGAASFTVTPPSSQTAVGVDWSTASSPEPNYFTDWPAVRVYRFTHAANAVAAYGARVVCVTDDPAISATGGATAAAALRAALETFYHGSGSAARQGVEYHFAARNEIDREYTSGTLPAAVVDTHRRCYEVLHELNGNGTRRYPNASAWIDLTVWQVQTAQAATRFAPCAPWLDGVACSLYNPGREVPVTFTAYPQYVDQMLNVPTAWGKSRFSIWETGTPIDKSATNGAPNNGGTTDWTRRPAYMTGQLDYVAAGCASRGVSFDVACYWNRQSDPLIPNPLKHDRSRAPLDTATAWHGWA